MVDMVVLEAIAARRESSSLSLSTKRSTSHCNQSVGVSKYSERRLNPDSNVDFYFGVVAQLAERYLCKVKDVGSSPTSSTLVYIGSTPVRSFGAVSLMGLKHINIIVLFP